MMIDKIRDMMEFIYDNHGLEKEKIIKKFSDTDLDELLTYNKSRDKPVINEIKASNNTKLSLTPKGVEELWRLKEVQARDQKINLLIVAGFSVAVIAFSSAYINIISNIGSVIKILLFIFILFIFYECVISNLIKKIKE